MKTTTHKAWAAAISTLLMAMLAIFGVGDMPAPESISEAGATIGAALAMSGASWLATYFIANKPKE